MEAGIPSSADYLCTSSRDSFHCNGAKSREASGAKPTEKCFYLARLSSLLKVRFFWESGRSPGEPTLWFEKKRLWSFNDDISRFLLYFLSLFFAITRRRLRRSSGLTIRGILGIESGRNCVNYSLISASDPWITSRRGCWSLSRLLSDVFEMAQSDTGGREENPSHARSAREIRGSG